MTNTIKRDRRKPVSSIEQRLIDYQAQDETNKTRNASPRHNTGSLLMQGTAPRDIRNENVQENLKRGSRALCRAILATGRTHAAMSEAAQLDAVRYAHNIMEKSK